MHKSEELLLQFLTFGAAAAIVALIVVKFYPANLIKQLTAQASNPEESQVLTKSAPDRISIPSIQLELPITAATISENQWLLYDDKVSWLSTSAVPRTGNVILYGHNRVNLFGNLKKVEAGGEIKIWDGAKTHSYKVVEKRQVAPGDVDVVLSDKDQLTLYTCDGSFDQKRLVVIAHPI